MRRLIIVVFIIALSSTAFARQYLYISHRADPKISVYDPMLDKVIREVSVGFEVRDMELSPDMEYLYFVSPETNSLHRMEIRNFRIDENSVAVGYKPESLVILEDGKTAYIINRESKDVSVVDIEKMRVVGNPIDLRNNEPRSIIASHDGSRVYVALAGMTGIGIIDTKTNKLLGAIKAGVDPWAMLLKEEYLFATNEGMNSVSVIDLNQNRTIQEMIASKGPRGLAWYNGFLYVAVEAGIDIFRVKNVRDYNKEVSAGFGYPIYDASHSRVRGRDRIYILGFDETTLTGKVAVID
ncbi:MAG TPA: hypothetical protein ENN55_01210, partial [Firmicutes bacterium]|nr:hypothetical protein [Bacillota bacterium]